MRLPWLSNRIRRRPRCRRATLCRYAGRAFASDTSLSWASTSLCSRFPGSRWLNRCRRAKARRYKNSLLRRRYCSLALFLNLGRALRHVFALVDPALHANDAVGGVSLSETEIDVRAQGLQRQTALQVPFFASDFRAVQPAGHAHLDAFAAEAQRGVHRFTHRAAKRHPLFKLQRDGFSHQLRVQLRAVHFLNIDVHFPLRALLHFLLELVDFRALAADDDAGPRGVNAHYQLVGGTLDIDGADARALEALFQFTAQLHILVQQVSVIAVSVPARLPRLVVAEPESV